MDDRTEKKRHTYGSKHKLAKLSEDQVSEIRKRYVYGCREHGTSALARNYKVSVQAVWLALKGKSWAHV